MKIKTFLMLFIAAAAVLSLGGCIIFANTLSVDLTADYTSCYWGEDVHLAVAVTGADPSSLTYQWYLDGVLQDGLTYYSNVLYQPPTAGTHSIRVDVSDGWFGSGTDSWSLSVSQGGVLRFDNLSTYYMDGVSVDAAGTLEFATVVSDNHLNSSVAPGTYNVDIPVPAYYSDWKVFASSVSIKWFDSANFTVGTVWDVLDLRNNNNQPSIMGSSGIKATILNEIPADYVPPANVLKGITKK